ncbi:T9SS type A sorting domain-containing protein [Taibaiella soli]|uniref:Secretion system C-terminal sorting domain-containing protein n=1 Tax=Taibaiella soli TaxID=1649169 RepID=A0A2W2B124_9BACT|nr:T9SS type A sorting domain-containing protein [Taibaiella soli]PZF73944.1 hypothetical protein DN068_06285 [Taibaiella soli]
MKQVLLTALLGITALSGNAQSVTDTVSVGTNAGGVSYPNNVWYSLPNDEQGSVSKKNWDLAFQVYGGYTASIMANNIGGTTVWLYPKDAATTTSWAAVDTNGLSTWSKLYNSDITWGDGALSRNVDVTNANDLGWGLYDMNTHYVMGDSIYIVKTVSGTYKKLWIKSLISSVYTFTFANLDGTAETTDTVGKATYAGQNFGYYSLDNSAALSREPLTANWDIVFGQYYSSAYNPPYAVTGVLQNNGVKVAKAVIDPSTVGNYVDTNHTFATSISTIGFDWKTFNGQTYDVNDSVVYFVKRMNNDIWKVVFTGFGGSTDGNFIFTKEKIFTAPPAPTAVGNVNAPQTSLALYPNPSRGQNVTLVYSFDKQVAGAKLNLFDLNGRVILSDNLQTSTGLYQYVLPTQSLSAGMYVISVEADGARTQQKLIVQ